MSSFCLCAFCRDCGKYKCVLGFDFYDDLLDVICPHCGASSGRGVGVAAKYIQTGRWPWQKEWVGRDGTPVDGRKL